ncbi:MAG TPA: tail fiber protein [Thermoanaerobaculia bacterium]|jgi:microcystin-dependent protein
MAEPFLSEIRIFSFNFPPKGWAFCNGQLLPINQNQALFALLGTAYGGNGQTNFALPNLRGRVPLHFGTSYSSVGVAGGQSAHTVTISELPQHMHFMQGTSNQTGNTAIPSNTATVATLGSQIYHAPTTLVALGASSVTSVGGSQPHMNQQPYLVLSFCIALQGIFPSRN